MTFEEYQRYARATEKFPPILPPIAYAALKLNGEAGEVAEKIGKLYRDKGGVIDDEFRAAVKLELGDVQWYLSALAGLLGYTLEEIAQANIDKLASRAARNVIHGDGDYR